MTSKLGAVVLAERMSIKSSVEAKMYPVLGCLLGELETPRSITASMDNSTSMMGRQVDVDGDFTYQWTYHPDNGLGLIITDDSV